MDETQTSSTNPNQSSIGSNGNEVGNFKFSKALEIEPQYPIQFSVIPGDTPFYGDSTLFKVIILFFRIIVFFFLKWF